jgi:putative endonuclease
MRASGISGLQMSWIGMQGWMLRLIDRLGASRQPKHLQVGVAGEREALFYLRGLGFVVVARRWKSVRLRGDVDLVAWDGETLCFVEVKTRTGRDAMEPADAAVDAPKQKMLRKMARAYLKGFPRELRDEVRVRFDVVSVYMMAAGPEFELRRGAFVWE